MSMSITPNPPSSREAPAAPAGPQGELLEQPIVFVIDDDDSVRRDGEARRDRAEVANLGARFDMLTPRERDVLRLVIQGRLNKQIAGDLGISEKTVKFHRGRVMEKTQAGSVAELVRQADRLGLRPRD